MYTYASPAEAFQAAQLCLVERKMQEAETISRELAMRFPENLAYSEALLSALFRQQKTEETLDFFHALIERHNPTGDPAYHAVYMDALRTTANSPVPLKRMLRFYELVKQLQHTLPLAGEVVECGCFRGMSSFLLCSYLHQYDAGFNGSGYHIFDSFRGLAEPTTEDEIPQDHKDARRLRKMSGAGKFAARLETVRRNLSAFPEIEYHPGWIPLTFQGLAERKYRFIHVDVDLYDPTWDCLDYFYPRLVTAGRLVSDDYGWPGARKAVDEFCAERGIALNVTAYNQAVLVKN